MIDRGHGRIVDVGIGAFLPRPGDATHCSTKAYLVTSAVRVKVQALCRGFTRTSFYERPEYASYDVDAAVTRGLWMSPEEVVAASLMAFAHDRPVCIPGMPNRLLVALGGWVWVVCW